MSDSDRPREPVDPELLQTMPLGTLPTFKPEQASTPPPPLSAEVVGGPMDGLLTTVDGEELRIGRASSNDVCLLLDGAVSKKHARIVRDGTQCWLEDLGSSNGTWLGDARIEERTLISPGATFRIGQTPLEFMPS